MATIGNFQRKGDVFAGSIRTLQFQADVRLVPNDRDGERAPDLIALVGDAQVGAAWEHRSRSSGKTYHSVKIDDPSLAGPIVANLVATEADPERFVLIWSR